MSMFQFKSKSSRGLVIVLVGVIALLTIYILIMVNKVYPIESDFGDIDDVSIDYTYTDYLGYEHSGTITDRTKIQNLSRILKRIQDLSPPRIKKVEEKAGPVPYMFVVKSDNRALYYSIMGEYLFVGKRCLFKTYSIYQLSQESSEELILFLRSMAD